MGFNAMIYKREYQGYFNRRRDDTVDGIIIKYLKSFYKEEKLNLFCVFLEGINKIIGWILERLINMQKYFVKNRGFLKFNRSFYNVESFLLREVFNQRFGR